MTEALHNRGLVAMARAVSRGELQATTLTRHYLDRIERLDGPIHAYLHVDSDGAMQQAASVDKARAAGAPLGPLCGVPMALKDNICTRGVPTTCASRILEGYVPPYDAHVVERLRAAGAVILGKLNMDEFAMGSSNENSAFGPTHNPHDPTRAAGGSSGGPAAAVAAGLAAATLGSDTGGSVRQPGAFCGVTALKPSYGRVSRYGLVAFASSLDQIGPIATSARDAAVVMQAIAGHDARDATSVDASVPDYLSACGQELKGVTVGLVRDFETEGCDPQVLTAHEGAIETLRGLGCDTVDVRLPHARHAVSVYYLTATSEASSNLARFDGMRYGLRVTGEDLGDTYGRTRDGGFGDEVKRRIMLGTYALSAGYYDAYYLKAQRVRTLIRRDYDAAFARCDVLVTPTAPTPAFALGEKTDDPLAMYLQDIFTLPASLAGITAASTPSGLSDAGLPMGLQVCAPAFEEARLLRVVDAFERAHGFQAAARLGEG